MKTLFINIKELLQIRDANLEKITGVAMKSLPTLKNAYLLIENNLIIDFGAMDKLVPPKVVKTVDCSGKMIFPTWCDSHTHIVYAGNREGEFADKINGLSYQEIAQKGGGILNSAKKLQKTSESELFQQAAIRVEEVISLGTGALEIKSGYGLDTISELKMLRVIKKLNETYPIAIKATFLGAHAFPEKYKDNKDGYVDLIINNMIPLIAKDQLADFVDVFCEVGYFTTLQTIKILDAAKAYGLQPKIHVNQFNSIGGVQVGVSHKAVSVDHLEVVTEQDIQDLQNSSTMPVALPSCSYFLGIPYAPARRIIDSGLALALASDYNPGSTPSGNMNFVVATACIKMKMTPEEAINAATINGAYAMGLEKTHGSICKGKKANFIITKAIPSYAFIPYSFGNNQIESFE